MNKSEQNRGALRALELMCTSARNITDEITPINDHAAEQLRHGVLALNNAAHHFRDAASWESVESPENLPAQELSTEDLMGLPKTIEESLPTGWHLKEVNFNEAVFERADGQKLYFDLGQVDINDRLGDFDKRHPYPFQGIDR